MGTFYVKDYIFIKFLKNLKKLIKSTQNLIEYNIYTWNDIIIIFSHNIFYFIIYYILSFYTYIFKDGFFIFFFISFRTLGGREGGRVVSKTFKNDKRNQTIYISATYPKDKQR